jgi:hypothetical protein
VRARKATWDPTTILDHAGKKSRRSVGGKFDQMKVCHVKEILRDRTRIVLELDG